MSDISGNSINQSIADYIETMSLDTEGTLKSIDLTLKAIARQDGLIISQSSLKDLADAERQAAQRERRSPGNTTRPGQQTQDRRNAYSRGDDNLWNTRNVKQKFDRMFDKMTDDLEDGFTDAFKQALFGSVDPFGDALKEPIRDFAKQIHKKVNGENAEIDNAVNELGKNVGQLLGKQVSNAFLDNPLGARLKREWQGIGNALTQSSLDFLGDAASFLEDPDALKNFKMEDALKHGKEVLKKNFGDAFEGMGDLGDLAKGVDGAADLVTDLPAIAEGAEVLGAQFPALGSAMAALGPEIAGAGSAVMGFAAAFPVATVAIAVAAVGVAVVLDKLSEAVVPAIEGFKSFGSGLSGAANRQLTQNAKFLELQKQRIEANAKTIKEAAYDVIKSSAQRVEEVWDNVLTTVSATQGYDKAGVQDLWSSYAQRLSESGLSSVVSSADIMSQLQSVLQSGLSGAVAEEFAYQATLLNSAVPTEDFFQYASTYASIAANAIKNGQSQEEAIAAANAELSAFANNVLYASRQLAGGFTTSLTNASDLFASATKIATASRTGDISDISGVLTSVSAIVGAIAPDLAGSLVDAVVSAATGGNSSQLTALRSMAGTGASNTAFLQAFASDPQKVFATLFSNLSQLQNMSSANYMEVAEALSGVFGISMDAFARVDFAYLADAISQMNVNSESLQNNLDLLASGQTTSTESQLRMQKINEYMVDQGLAYVLDNEVARSIQEHMWEEQLAQEIEETMFAVDLQGGALDLINGLVTTVTKIADIINPVAWAKKITNVALTAVEIGTQNQELKDILELGKVGKGNGSAFTNLTTVGTQLHLAESYVSLLGGASGTGVVKNLIDLNNLLGSPLASNALKVINTLGGLGTESLVGKSDVSAQATGKMAANSYYTRAVISKSAASAFTSGDWRTNQGYNALYNNYAESGTDTSGPRTSGDADKLSEAIESSMQIYLETAAKSSSDSAILADLTSKEHRGFYSQQDLTNAVTSGVAKLEASKSQGSFSEWVAHFNATNSLGIKNLEADLDNYGRDLEYIRSIYESQETARSNASTKARELHEVQFWEDMQNFATIDFPHYMSEWEKYYIQHTAYTSATNDAYKEAVETASKEKKESGTAIFALAEALSANENWTQKLTDELKDPVVQTNALLSQILLITDAIRQQNNDTSIVSVPTALSSLGLGVVTSSSKSKK